MKEKKQIKVSLGTTVCLFIIFLLVIALVGMWLYFNEDIKNNGNNNIAKVEEKVERQQEEENKDDTYVEENIRDYEYKETITLNNKTHEIGFLYEKTDSENQSTDFPDEKLKIFFDEKKVKSYEMGEEKERPEIKIIKGDDNRQYAIIKVSQTNPTYKQYYFNFINEDGEIIGIIEYSTGTSVIYKGEMLTYEINDNALVKYEPTWLNENEFSNCAVVKYKIRVYDSKLNVYIEDVYSYDEVEMAGARR